uniref:PPM-type phosphatase domain-containing protein n=1 Tax=Anopheles maculatus TaxID=74869 RepID=A0A182S9T9_9DIPT
FVISENINSSGISLFAIFDGHGGEYAAEYAKNVLIKNIHQKLMQSSALADGREPPAPTKAGLCADDTQEHTEDDEEKAAKDVEKSTDKEQEVNERYKLNAHNGNGDPSGTVQRRQSFRKSKTEDTVGSSGGGGGGTGGGGGGAAASSNQMLENDLLSKYMGNQSPARQQVKKNLLNGTSGSGPVPVKPKTYEARCYVQNGSINFGKIITDEVLAADYDLVEAAKKLVSNCVQVCLFGTVPVLCAIDAMQGDFR